MKSRSILIATSLLAAFAVSAHAQNPFEALVNPPDVAAQKKPADEKPATEYKTADELWNHMQELNKLLKTKTDNKQEFMACLRENEAAVNEFLKRFPDDKHKWEAKIADAQLAAIFARAGMKGYDADKMQSVAKEIVAAPDAPASLKQDARFALVARRLREHDGMDRIAADIAAYLADYPDDQRSTTLNFLYAKELRNTESTRAEAIFKDLAKGKNQQIADFAQAELKALGLKNKPFDLKFTAVDGSAFDIAALHGKVVLVDFWAAAYRPSVLQIPDIIELSKKYRAKGFEIVGISLDKDKQLLLGTVKDRGITWPQYFDGKGTGNDIAATYGIRSIPRLLLVNKGGILVSIDAGKNIEAEIEKLLAE